MWCLTYTRDSRDNHETIGTRFCHAGDVILVKNISIQSYHTVSFPTSKPNNQSTMPKRKHKGGPEITFDPEARRSYLRGFSERKKQRRAFGLAMQAKKDRKERLTERKERKESLMEQIEQSEQAKMEILEGVMLEEGRIIDDAGAGADAPEPDTAAAASASKDTTTAPNNTKQPPGDTKVQKYDDQETEERWGGRVVVTTSTAIPGDDDSDNDNAKEPPRRRGRNDKHQEYAGSVDRFLSQTVKKLPAKKVHRSSKGKHGASDMKGVGGAAGLQAAQKFLKRSHDKKGKREGKKKKRR